VGLSGLSKTLAEQFQARMLELTGFTTVLIEAELNRPAVSCIGRGPTV
jgi:hypothetical protein